MDRHTFSPEAAGGPGQDYILRQIEDFASFLGKLVGRIQRREIAGAVKQIESFYRDHLSSDAGLIHTLSDQALIGLLRKDGELDPIRCVNLAKVLSLDADLASLGEAGKEGLAPIARVKYLLSFSLLMEIGLGAGLPDYAEPDLDALAARIADWALPHGPAYKLFRYQERKGCFGKAEDMLFNLKESGYPEVAREGLSFYRRLAALSDGELSRGNLPRAELEEGRRHFLDSEPLG